MNRSMYETAPNLNELRQGDIISDIYLPKFGITDTHFLHKLKDDGNWEFSKQTVMNTAKGYAAVISQCCEFNVGKRNSFSLAQLIGLGESRLPTWKLFGFNLAEVVPWRGSGWRESDISALLKTNSLEDENLTLMCTSFHLRTIT